MEQDKEIFLPIKDYENHYEISNHGRVRRFKRKGNNRETITKGRIDVYGYYRVTLCVLKFCKTIKIHQLVARHFIPNPDNKNTVNHIDGNKSNNHLSNLEWCTYAENNIHAYKTGLKDNKGMDNGRSKLTDAAALEVYKAKGRQIDIAKEHGISQNLVSCIKRGVNWNHVTKHIQA